MADRSKTRERTSSATDKPEKSVAPASSATIASKELEDTTAIRNRLVVVNDRRVSTLTAKYFAFIRAAESDTTTLDEVELAEGQIQKEFDLFDISLDKLRATANANDRELQQYHSLHLQRESQIARAKEELVRLKTELEHEKRRRNHKEEYEAIAKIINQYPSRAETQRQLQALEADLASLADAKQQIEDVTQKRRKQFALLFDCIDDLQRALRAEEEEAKEDESRKESVTTGKRKRPAAEADDTLKGKALADDPPAVSSSAETSRKRVREVEMEEARDEETEPGEITTKEVTMADGV